MLCLKPGVYFKSVTSEALKAYCADFLYCGNCFRALTDFISLDEVTGKYKYEGYIFAVNMFYTLISFYITNSYLPIIFYHYVFIQEVCESIQRHLVAYRTIALSLPTEKNLLGIHAHVHSLYKNIDVLAFICKVGPYADEQGIPIGGALLSYLCKSAMNSTSNDTLMVLCSMLFPCCQVYFK